MFVLGQAELSAWHSPAAAGSALRSFLHTYQAPFLWLSLYLLSQTELKFTPLQLQNPLNCCHFSPKDSSPSQSKVLGAVVMPLCVLLLPRHWLAVEYVWVLVPYMTYDIYVMYLCHWHKSQEKGILEKKHSLVSVWSFLLQERLMVTHHLFILIVLTPITQVRAAAGVQDPLHMLGAGSWTPLCRALCSLLPFFTALQGRAGRLLRGLHLHSRAEHAFCFTGQNPHAGRSGGMGHRAEKPPAICHLSPSPGSG